MATTNLLHCQRHNRSWQGDGTDAPQGCPWCENERLRAALSQSCEEARSVALAEPNRTRTCPLERELRQEIERLRAERDECRRLLRFVIDFHDMRTKTMLGLPYTAPYVLPDNFLSDAASAAGGDT